MKTKLNADGTLTVNSVKFKELGDAIKIASAKTEKARRVHEECDMEFDESTFVGNAMLAELRRMERNV